LLWSSISSWFPFPHFLYPAVNHVRIVSHFSGSQSSACQIAFVSTIPYQFAVDLWWARWYWTGTSLSTVRLVLIGVVPPLLYIYINLYASLVRRTSGPSPGIFKWHIGFPETLSIGNKYTFFFLNLEHESALVLWRNKLLTHLQQCPFV